MRRCKNGYLTSTFCHLMDKNGFVATYEKVSIRNELSTVIQKGVLSKRFNYIAKPVLSTNRNNFGTIQGFI